MTWSRFDDAAPTHPKARKAGNEAWSLWCAAVMYCNRYLTDGEVTVEALADDCLPMPIAKTKAKKLADRLCSARVRADEAGLFEHVEGDTYRVHGFLDWNPSKSDVEEKRRADRERKRVRAASAAPTAGQTTESGVPPPTFLTDSARNPNGGQSDGERTTPAPAPAPARAQGPAIPAVPSPPLQQGRQPCPSDIGLLPEQRATLETVPIPGWAIDAITITYRAKYAGNTGDTRTLEQWRRGLVTTIQGTWNDPNKRPKKPEPFGDGKPRIELPKGVRFGTEGL